MNIIHLEIRFKKGSFIPMNKQQLVDEADLCGSLGERYLLNPKAKYTAEPPLASAISSTGRPFIVLSKIPITGVFI